jgi:hypothetical protein
VRGRRRGGRGAWRSPPAGARPLRQSTFRRPLQGEWAGHRHEPAGARGDARKRSARPRRSRRGCAPPPGGSCAPRPEPSPLQPIDWSSGLVAGERISNRNWEKEGRTRRTLGPRYATSTWPTGLIGDSVLQSFPRAPHVFFTDYCIMNWSQLRNSHSSSS